MLTDELKKGTTPFLILALLEIEPRHGYELSKLLDQQSKGVVHVHASSLYPLLYRLEKERLIQGRWVEKEGSRRRRYYQITAEGKRDLTRQRREWMEFVKAIGDLTGVAYA
jgi:PadR family transcriptional regulator, regulatory protein PadR